MRFTLKTLGLGASLLTCSVLWPASAAAQAPLRAESSWTVDARPAMWTAPASTGTRWSESFARPEPAPAVVVAKDKETGLTLMIVGGAAVVVGLVIGDTSGTLLAVGGVGVGAYGLYLYID